MRNRFCNREKCWVRFTEDSLGTFMETNCSNVAYFTDAIWVDPCKKYFKEYKTQQEVRDDINHIY